MCNLFLHFGAPCFAVKAPFRHSLMKFRPTDGRLSVRVSTNIPTLSPTELRTSDALRM